MSEELEITNENTPELSQAECLSIIEAVLYAAGHPITYEKLAETLNLTKSEVRKLVSEYALIYNSYNPEFPRGIILLEFDESCQLCTKEQYGNYVREALGIKRGGNLSQSSIEVLSIVAYNQPTTRTFIDTVRGVDSSYVVSSLCEKHLIEACGRLDVPGRPLLYRTTPDFLRVFGINSLTELPTINPIQTINSSDILPIEGIDEEIEQMKKDETNLQLELEEENEWYL